MYLKNHINLPIKLKHRLRFRNFEIGDSINFAWAVFVAKILKKIQQIILNQLKDWFWPNFLGEKMRSKILQIQPMHADTTHAISKFHQKLNFFAEWVIQRFAYAPLVSFDLWTWLFIPFLLLSMQFRNCFHLGDLKLLIFM